MTNLDAINPHEHAVYRPDKMGKATLFESESVVLGLNAFEPGQSHSLHTHADMDKVYQVLEGTGVFLIEDREVIMGPGLLLVAPRGVPHGVRNNSDARLLLLTILAPPPSKG